MWGGGVFSSLSPTISSEASTPAIDKVAEGPLQTTAIDNGTSTGEGLLQTTDIDKVAPTGEPDFGPAAASEVLQIMKKDALAVPAISSKFDASATGDSEGGPHEKQTPSPQMISIKRGDDGFLGVGFRKLSAEVEEEYKVFSFIPNKPAELNGQLRLGDEIIEVNGVKIKDKPPIVVSNAMFSHLAFSPSQSRFSAKNCSPPRALDRGSVITSATTKRRRVGIEKDFLRSYLRIWSRALILRFHWSRALILRFHWSNRSPRILLHTHCQWQPPELSFVLIRPIG